MPVCFCCVAVHCVYVAFDYVLAFALVFVLVSLSTCQSSNATDELRYKNKNRVSVTVSFRVVRDVRVGRVLRLCVSVSIWGFDSCLCVCLCFCACGFVFVPVLFAAYV